MPMRHLLITLALLLSFAAGALCQTPSERLKAIRYEMDDLVDECPEYSESVDISVGRMHLSELLRTVAQIKEVNLSVRDDFDCVVSCSFTRSRIDDLIVFLCSEYGLDIEIYGNIVSIFRYVAPAEPYTSPDIHISPADSLLTFRISGKRLGDVTGLSPVKS